MTAVKKNKILICMFALYILRALLPADAAASPRISLLLGDLATGQAVNIVRELQSVHSELREARIEVYTSTRIREQDLEHLKHSDLVIIQIIARPFVTGIREELAQTMANGGRVYAFGNGYNDEDAQMGIRADAEMRRYFEIGGEDNVRSGLLYALSSLGLSLPYDPPRDIPEVGIYDFKGKALYTDFASFRENYQGYQPGRPWIGFVVYRSNIVAGTNAHYEAVVSAIERHGFNVLPVFGHPAEQPIERFFFDTDGKARVDAVVAAAMKIGVNPDALMPLLHRLGVPIVNAISLRTPSSHAEWRESSIGMNIMERSWQLALAETVATIQPTVFAVKETVRDATSGIEHVEERPIAERVEMLASRIERWVELRRKPNHEKRILLHYFNFPSGQGGIGASYLNVAPESLWTVMQRMSSEGYRFDAMPADPEALRVDLLDYGINIPPWNQALTDRLARSGEAVLLPMERYVEWFAELPASMRDDMIRQWGRPESNTMMAHTGDDGREYFVLPVRRYGNILLAPQPSSGWLENIEHAHHDRATPPSHQYVAFYLWLHKEFRPDAMVQFGTHGNLEWLPGKEAGLNIDDWPEYLTRDLPNIYAYIMDNPGEAMQAKRRGMSVMVSHLTPPFGRSGLNPELRELQSRINDYQIALQRSPMVAEAHLDGIVEMAKTMGIFTDIGVRHEGTVHHEAHDDIGEDHYHHVFSDDMETEDIADMLQHYLEEVSGNPTPFGMHTLGVAPRDDLVRSTAEAIASFSTGTTDGPQHGSRVEALAGLIRLSAQRELNAIVNGLAGRFIDAGVGGDPLRRPNALPTGRNFHSFDPRRIPADSTYSLGARLAGELIEAYREKHDTYPDKLTFNVWGVETMRHEGVTEAQIMYLMGVRPVWDAGGTVVDVEAIPRAELGRPRIDVTMIASGDYRDLFSNVMALLDKAASVAQAQDEPDNAVRNHAMATRAMLEQRGIKDELAARLAAVRLFSMPSGAYGTNLNYVADRSDTWDDEQQVADVYFARMNHMYGQGFWGESGDDAGVGKDLLKNALSGTKIAVHSRSSNVYQTLDTDDVFQYLGGVSMAIRAVDGATPEVYVSNLSNPAQARQETLDRMMGREMRTRYLNPEWIKAMQQEGYAGARFINRVVQNLWGWQVTIPEAVDAAKWNEMYETYVGDRYQLDMEQFFREAGNLWALQALMTRMLEAVRKGYWEADEATVAELGRRVGDLIVELQQDCSAEHCHDPILTRLVEANLVPVPALQAMMAAMPEAPQQGGKAPDDASQADMDGLEQVRGYAMEEVTRDMQPEFERSTRLIQITGFLLLCLALGWGFHRTRAR